MVRKSIKRVTESGTISVEPVITADITTNPFVDDLLDRPTPGTEASIAMAAKIASERSESKQPKLSEAVERPAQVSIVSVPHEASSNSPVEATQYKVFTPLPTPMSGRVVRMQTIRLGQAATDLNISWGSRFDPAQCKTYLHRVSATSNPTGHLSGPVFENSNPVQLQLRIVRDNFPTPLPEGSIYLGSYSDIHVGPAMHSLHVFLLP